MRIAHVTPVYPPYAAGAGVACFYLAREHAARGHEVHVFTAQTAGEPPASGARVHGLRPLLRLGAAPLLPELYRLPEVDLVHVHHPFIFGIEPVLLAALRRPRTPLVVSYHNRLVGSGLRRPLFAAYEETLGRALARRADRLCVLSEPHAETVSYLRTARRRRPERLAIVPNGVDTERFSPGRAPAVRAAAGIREDAVVAVHVATLDRTHFLKRTDLALEAAARVEDERLHVLVVGDGEWRGALESSPAARRLGPRVRFLGHRDHDALPGALRAGDFFVLSSDLDAFPLVLLEALACGLPAASTDPPGVRAMLAGAGAALISPAGDAAALARSIAELTAMAPERRAAMGAAARALCEQRYALAAVAERMEEVYAQAARSARERGA